MEKHNYLLFILVLLIGCSPSAQLTEKDKIYYPKSKGVLKESDYYMISNRDLRTFRDEGIPDSTIQKLKGMSNYKVNGVYEDRAEFLKELVEKIGLDQAHQYKNTILYHSKRSLLINPEVIKRVNPYYPVWVRKKGVEGLVVVKVLIDTLGNVVSSEVLKSIPELDGPSRRAAQKFKFTQGMVDDPAMMWMTIPFTYSIKK